MHVVVFYKYELECHTIEYVHTASMAMTSQEAVHVDMKRRILMCLDNIGVFCMNWNGI